MLFKSFAFTALFVAAPLVSAAGKGTQKPAQEPQIGPDTVHGCYSSKGKMVLADTNKFQTQGSCAATCKEKGNTAAATQSDQCFCGDSYPPKSTLTKDENCGEPCPGFDTDACGGLDTWTVYNLGVRKQLPDDPDPKTSSSAATSAATSTAPAAVTTSGEYNGFCIN